ncbi:MAG TPA: CDP-alcohol phosphatidyltransferase family protein [Planktothrix sp.]|jgi:CDP-diacylglycerol--glycerol-3-phosphate 3-phosphatidyltransferase
MITSVRLVAAIAILTGCHFWNCQPYFLALFVIAGISDMLDGFIARKFDCCTEFGATLDSVSDLLLYFAGAIFLTLTATNYICASMVPIVIGAAVQVFHLAYSFHKFRKFPAYHSVYSRVSAYAIYFSVIAFCLWKPPFILSTIAIMWTACSLEGIIISTILQRATINVDSIFVAIRLKDEIVQEKATRPALSCGPH